MSVSLKKESSPQWLCWNLWATDRLGHEEDKYLSKGYEKRAPDQSGRPRAFPVHIMMVIVWTRSVQQRGVVTTVEPKTLKTEVTSTAS